MVEFALVIPIFLLILASIADAGFFLFERMTVINAAREGARAAAMVTDATTIADRATAAAQSAAQQGGVTLSTVVVTCTHAGSTLPSCNTAVIGDYVTVKTSFVYHTFTPLAFGATVNLDSTVQMILDSIGSV